MDWTRGPNLVIINEIIIAEEKQAKKEEKSEKPLTPPVDNEGEKGSETDSEDK